MPATSGPAPAGPPAPGRSPAPGGPPAHAGPPAAGPPSAPRFPHVRHLHGTAEVDEYAWMSGTRGTRGTRAADRPERSQGVSSAARPPGSAEFLAYLAAERAYYDAQTEPLRGLIGELFGEAASRVPDRDEESVRWPLRGFEYWTRTPAGSENRQFLRAGPGPRDRGAQDGQDVS